MCIMEVRLGQRDSTIAQACAHNIGTVLSDLELFRPVLKARNPEMMPVFDNLYEILSATSRDALQLWAMLVEKTVAAQEDHTHDHLGSEREESDHFHPTTPSADETRAMGGFEDPELQVEFENRLENYAAHDMSRAAEYETRK